MKKTWKKILAAGCALSMLLTVPGMPVLGAEGYDEEITFAEEILNDESQEFDAVEAEIIDESQMNGVEADSQISEEALSGAKSLQNDLIVGRVDNNYLSLSFDREEQFQERINPE